MRAADDVAELRWDEAVVRFAAVPWASRWLFDDHGFERVQASTDGENIASQRTLEPAGFSREGVLRSYFPAADGKTRVYHVMYLRLATDLLS